MSAQAPELAECVGFLLFWTQITHTTHITCVAIHPDQGSCIARTFAVSELVAARLWISEQQQTGRNCYFQANQTRPDCNRKPGKRDMVAAHCRFADVDPLDDHFQLSEERVRLAKLATHLATDPEYPPTVLIDSGNGLQVLWATTPESLSAACIQRIEGETEALEYALGADAARNIDRLLRLPGSLNYPGPKKRLRGRVISRARLISCTPTTYSPMPAAQLAQHVARRVAGTGLVRRKVQPARDRDIHALMAALKAAGADSVSRLEHLPAELQARFKAALSVRQPLANRWRGMVDDLTAAGRDDTRSGADMSLAAMAKAAGFSYVEAGLILCAFPHGKANGETWNRDMRLRHVARSVLRSYSPSDTVWPDPVDFLASPEITGSPELKPDHLPDAIAGFVFDTATRMGVDPAAVALAALVSCSASACSMVAGTRSIGLAVAPLHVLSRQSRNQQVCCKL
jgi:hypothetical protein